MGDTGLEQPTCSNWKVAISPEGDAKSDASGAGAAILTEEELAADVPLQQLLAVWPMLTIEDRRRIANAAELAVGEPQHSEGQSSCRLEGRRDS